MPGDGIPRYAGLRRGGGGRGCTCRRRADGARLARRARACRAAARGPVGRPRTRRRGRGTRPGSPRSSARPGATAGRHRGVGALIAADPALSAPRRPRCWRAPRRVAVRDAAEAGRDPRALPDPDLAQRAGDCGRSLGGRGMAHAARHGPRTARSSWSAAGWTRRT
jgi:hypothetical protein